MPRGLPGAEGCASGTRRFGMAAPTLVGERGPADRRRLGIAGAHMVRNLGDLHTRERDRCLGSPFSDPAAPHLPPRCAVSPRGGAR